jgi:hypothetical protein
VEGSGHSVFKVLPRHLLGGDEENHENPEDTWSPDWDLNLILPKYEAAMLRV